MPILPGLFDRHLLSHKPSLDTLSGSHCCSDQALQLAAGRTALDQGRTRFDAWTYPPPSQWLGSLPL
jgi:hypothetical protein